MVLHIHQGFIRLLAAAIKSAPLCSLQQTLLMVPVTTHRSENSQNQGD